MRAVACGVLLAVLLLPANLLAEARDEMLWHYRNLGKAFYENAATQDEAVEMFKKALELAPDSARERVNYGLALLRVAGKGAEGIAQLDQAQKQDPTIPHTWFNLGIAYKRASQYARAIAQLEGMLRTEHDSLFRVEWTELPAPTVFATGWFVMPGATPVTTSVASALVVEPAELVTTTP